MKGCKICQRHQLFFRLSLLCEAAVPFFNAVEFLQELGKQAGCCMLLSPHVGSNKCQWESHA